MVETTPSTEEQKEEAPAEEAETAEPDAEAPAEEAAEDSKSE